MSYKMTDEHRRKLREANKGKKHNMSLEAREKLSKLHKGKPLSDEIKKAISDGHKRYYADEDNKKRLCEWLKGHVCTEETKHKISESNRGKVYNEESRNKISNSVKAYLQTETEQHLQERIKKSNNTKRTNHTFNTSKPEEIVFELLQNKFNGIHRQYSSDLYRFACDFYIDELDLYIECHFGWMHGGKPFSGIDDELYMKWKERSEVKPIYKQAIYTWTDLDVRKLKTFKDNKLNYKIFYTFEEFIEWYNR